MTLEEMTMDELVTLFTSNCEQQYPLTISHNNKKITPLIRKEDDLDKELRRRGIQARLELIKLFDHPNIQVRLNAAKRSLGIARESALGVLRHITKEDVSDFKLDAGMTIALFEDGIIKPD